MVEFINVADLINPDTGNTYRHDNLAKAHAIPLGTLVEICWEGEPDNGIRLHVVAHKRDCDGTPLYSLGLWAPEDGQTGTAALVYDDSWYPPTPFAMFGGYGEENLKVVEGV